MKPFTSQHSIQYFTSSSPLQRREVSDKEKRLQTKLDKVQDKKADHYFEGDGEKNYHKKQDRLERKELRVEQRLDRERKKQSRKSLGLEGTGANKKQDRQERKNLRVEQKEHKQWRKEREQK